MPPAPATFSTMMVRPKALGHRLREKAPDDIGRAAGSERNDECDVPCRIVLRARSARPISAPMTAAQETSRFMSTLQSPIAGIAKGSILGFIMAGKYAGSQRLMAGNAARIARSARSAMMNGVTPR